MHCFAYSSVLAAGSTWDILPAWDLGSLQDTVTRQDIADASGMVPVLYSAWLCLHACVTTFTGIKNSLGLRN